LGISSKPVDDFRGWEERRRQSRKPPRRPGVPATFSRATASSVPPSPAPEPARSSSKSTSGVYTELQCGSYIFMDADYGRNLDRDGAPTKAFEPSLVVWATVMSRPTEDRAIVDAGLKALAFDSGPPLVCDEPAATYERASDEHGRLGISGATNRLRVGDKTRLIPGHCDPHRQSLRLVRLHPRGPRRATLAHHRPRRGLLTLVGSPHRRPARCN